MSDDDATQEASTDHPLPTTELGTAPIVNGPLAYSEHTTSMPVIEYRAPRLAPARIVGLVLAAAAALAGGMFALGRTMAPQKAAPPAPVPTSAPAQPSAMVPPPVAAPPPIPAVVPPPVAAPPIAVLPPTQPAPTTSTPPLATPQARIAEPGSAARIGDSFGHAA